MSHYSFYGHQSADGMATVLLSELNRSFNPSCYGTLDEESSDGALRPWFSLKMAVWTGWWILVTVFLFLNLKNLPGMWHMRILNAFRFILRTQRPPIAPSHSHIFLPLITTSSAPLLEIDFNIHKTNSSYFSDLDISRTHLVCTLFASGIERMRGGTEAYTGSKNPQFGLALGAVSCNFRKEVLPYQSYEMWSRILSWDEKWIYIVTHFVRKGTAKPRDFSLYPTSGSTQCPNAKGRSDDSSYNSQRNITVDPSSPDQGLFATALSKCVFKSGRKTVSPDTMFKLSGLLPTAPDGPGVSHVEAQRLDGLRAASGLAIENQKALEAEFSGADGQALGKHTDGSGFGGVASTLLQLAGLKRSQLI